MLIVLLIAAIALMVIGFLFDSDGAAITGSVSSFLLLVVLAFAIGSLVNIRTIDAKLEMYQIENDHIEHEVSAVVEGYKDYESGVFKNISADSPIVLVNLYPELKADELVCKQIDIYCENNEFIKKLKLDKIDASNYKWWIFFGK